MTALGKFGQADLFVVKANSLIAINVFYILVQSRLDMIQSIKNRSSSEFNELNIDTIRYCINRKV
jgi:hypothetical protein